MSFQGTHRWLQLVVHMDDYCARGTAWQLWDQIVFVDADQPVPVIQDQQDRDEDQDQDQDGSLNWMNYAGRWGNIQKLVSR
jgi:hypothetical protein